MGAPTLIVGLGGIGGNVVTLLADRIAHEHVQNVELVVMDTDVNDLREIRSNYPNIYTVQTSPKGTVGRALDQNAFARERWFPLNDGLTGKPFTEGAGQVRAVSRLAFDHAVEQGYMEDLEKAIAKLHGLTGDSLRQEMRIIITGSIAGGTGSGLVLPVAMYIRNFLITRYQDNSAIIRGFFLEPDVVFGRLIDEDERNAQRANAYASLRELDAFFRKEYAGTSSKYAHVVFNAPQPGIGERIDYPNILPYHFVFLMDAINADGDSLTDAEGRYDLDGYKQHAADCIYAQALSAVSARGNSGEDNVIRKLAANNGRSRYCGAGTSCLEYPKDDVQRYISYSWVEQSISNEWLEIDNEYQRRLREEPNLQLSTFYRHEYDGKRSSNSPFYKAIIAQSERKDKNGEPIDVIGQYIDDLVAHAENWATGVDSSDSLLTRSAVLRKCIYDDNNNERLKPLSENTDAILEKCKEESDAASIFQNDIGSYFSDVKRYSSVAQEEVADLARAAAKSAFVVSDFDKNPLKSRDKDWQVESIFAVKDGNSFGTYHPAAVRYMLYCLADALRDRANEAKEDAEAAKTQMQRAERADYYGPTEETEDPDEAVSLIFSDDNKGRGISLPILNNGSIGVPEAENLAEICKRLNSFGKNVNKYVKETVVYSFLEGALNYVSSLVSSYEDFYSYIGKQIENVHAKIAAIEENPQYNETKGSAHRYVCANSQCLGVMKDICRTKSTSGELPLELCGDIYTSLLGYSKIRSTATSYSVRSSMSGELFDELFQSAVIDYWMTSVMDVHAGYPNVIDKSIIQAIADEALYTSDTVFVDKEKENEYITSYILSELDEAEHLSTPFIEPPDGEVPRHIYACAFSEAAFDNVGAYGALIHKTLINSYAGIEVDRYDFSKYEILFYSTLYGFCADNLPKYAPYHEGVESRPEGEYHRAYFTLVDQLSPNLHENKFITPHIDKNWHLVFALPDLSEENERRIENDIVHAFLFGLVFQQFDAEITADDDIFYLKASSMQRRTDLWVSNGTPCDRFYEIYDSLKYSPPAVRMLLDRSSARLKNEKDNTQTESFENCALVEQVRSRAFVDYDSAVWSARILEAIHDLSGLDAYVEPVVVPLSLVSGYLDSSCVTNLFGYGSDLENRTSIFEIPLLYRISLPQTELREGEIDYMVECIFGIFEEHFSNFCESSDLIAYCCQFFEEQYLLFEWNLIGYEQLFPNIHTNSVVSNIREKTLSYLEQSNSSHKVISGVQNQIKDAWRQYREQS